MRLRFFAFGLVLLIPFGGCSCGGGTSTTNIDASFPDGSYTPDGGQIDAARQDAGDASVDTDAGPCGHEICGNGLDDDCDGRVDNGCSCVPGDTAPCYRGSAATRGVGVCQDGTMVCGDGLEFGSWGDCMGDVLPSSEVCDSAGLDENCDGAVNEGCECSPGDPPVACGTDVGACTPGTQTCVDGMLGPCEGAVGPVAETCNGIDDDCDGMVDEGLTRSCGTDMGECTTGTQACVGGAWETACTGAHMPATEDCNGLDDDCDGMVDEGLTRSCGSAVGACTAGTQSCSGGSWSTCTGGVTPTVETCNGIDDDCDGTVDGMTRSCGTDVGVCMSGTQTCTAGTWSTTCAGSVGPSTEICDGLDNNCDGTVDEGCSCISGATRSCGTDVGVCTFGNQTCDSSGNWGPCTGGVGPSTEICDGLDNNCDGMVDEGGICPTAPPVVMCPADITAMVLATVSLSGTATDPDGGTVTYSWTVTSRPTGSTAMPASPTSPTTTFFLDASGDYVVQMCATDDEGDTTCCSTTIHSIPPGTLHVELSWDTAYGDVDLHLLNVTRTPPDGWWTTDDCYFANRTPDWGPVGAAANPTLDRDDTNGYGPENTTIDSSPQSGTYHIGVHYYCEHSLGSGAAPGDGPTTGTVRVYCAGSLIATYTGLTLSGTDDWINVASVDYPSCVGMSIDTHTYGSSVIPSTFTTAPHCEISCSTDSDCPPAERCATVGGGGPPRLACILR